MKNVKKYVSVGLLLVLAVALVGIPGTVALPSYASALQTVYGVSACGTCHIDPAGGGTLTPYGTTFAAQSNHATDPQAALIAIGAPPGVTPPAPTPAPEPITPIIVPPPEPAPVPAPVTPIVAPAPQPHQKDHDEDDNEVDDYESHDHHEADEDGDE